MKEWITQAEYARRYGMSRAAVNRATKAGRLPMHGKMVNAAFDIRLTRRRDPVNAKSASAGSAGEIGEQIQRARLAKLQADTAVQRRRDDEAREEWRHKNLREFATMFAESYASFPQMLVELSLDDGTTRELVELWHKSHAAMMARVDEMCNSGEGDRGRRNF